MKKYVTNTKQISGKFHQTLKPNWWDQNRATKNIFEPSSVALSIISINRGSGRRDAETVLHPGHLECAPQGTNTFAHLETRLPCFQLVMSCNKVFPWDTQLSNALSSEAIHVTDSQLCLICCLYIQFPWSTDCLNRHAEAEYSLPNRLTFSRGPWYLYQPVYWCKISWSHCLSEVT